MVNFNKGFVRFVVVLGLALVAIFVAIFIVNSTTQISGNFHHIYERSESIFISEFYHTKHGKFTKR